MFERYDVFKEIIINDKHNNAVRNYFFSTNINKIVIYRKNKLKQAISHVFSKTSQMWHPTEKDRDVYNKEIDGIKISLNEVRSTLNYINFQYKLLFKELKEKKHFLVVYEDLFFDNVENQKLLLKNMFNFCNLKFDEDQKIMNLLSNGRINSNETYKKIINHQEIEDAFGNKENGFLFD
jgi:nickel-dependent lactate racemase